MGLWSVYHLKKALDYAHCHDSLVSTMINHELSLRLRSITLSLTSLVQRFGACPALMAIIMFNISCFLFGINFGWQTSGIIDVRYWCEVVCQIMWGVRVDGIMTAIIVLSRNELVPGSSIDAQHLGRIPHNTWDLQTRCATYACMHAWPHEHSG